MVAAMGAALAVMRTSRGLTRREKKVENFSIIISSRERHHRDLQGTKPFGMTEETLERCGVADV